MNILAMNVKSHQSLKNQNSWKKHICVFRHRGMLNPDNEWKEEDFER